MHVRNVEMLTRSATSDSRTTSVKGRLRVASAGEDSPKSQIAEHNQTVGCVAAVLGSLVLLVLWTEAC